MGGAFTTGVISHINRILFPFDSGTSSNVGNIESTVSANSGIDGTDFVTQFI